MAFTFFMRDQPTLEHTADHMIPYASGRSRIKVWDAGWALGQETYTIAMIFAEKMNQFGFKNLSIAATDYDSANNFGNVVTAAVSDAAIAGKLATRADASKHQGDFQKIVTGVNETLDAVIGPLNVAAEYVDRISKGDIPPKITDNYNGDFNEIKLNLNNAIDNINALVADADMLSQAAVEGRLSTRADNTKHHGDFRKIVDGVNSTIGRLVGLLDAMPTPAMIINNDFEVLYMNELGARVGGKGAAEVVGKKCYDHFKTSDCKTQK
jgi:methyl-accepting chemotaxis protein